MYFGGVGRGCCAARRFLGVLLLTDIYCSADSAGKWDWPLRTAGVRVGDQNVEWEN